MDKYFEKKTAGKVAGRHSSGAVVIGVHAGKAAGRHSSSTVVIRVHAAAKERAAAH